MPQPNEGQIITAYTDGSCHTQKKIGGWAAILFIGNNKTILSGKAENTTHNRMELIAAIETIQYITEHKIPFSQIKIITDSQYLIGLEARKGRFEAKEFTTNSGKAIQNVDLVKTILGLIAKYNVAFEKIKAHQKPTDTTKYNIEVDKLSRKIVREGF